MLGHRTLHVSTHPLQRRLPSEVPVHGARHRMCRGLCLRWDVNWRGATGCRRYASRPPDRSMDLLRGQGPCRGGCRLRLRPWGHDHVSDQCLQCSNLVSEHLQIHLQLQNALCSSHCPNRVLGQVSIQLVADLPIIPEVRREEVEECSRDIPIRPRWSEGPRYIREHVMLELELSSTGWKAIPDRRVRHERELVRSTKTCDWCPDRDLLQVSCGTNLVRPHRVGYPAVRASSWICISGHMHESRGVRTQSATSCADAGCQRFRPLSPAGAKAVGSELSKQPVTGNFFPGTGLAALSAKA